MEYGIKSAPLEPMILSGIVKSLTGRKLLCEKGL